MSSGPPRVALDRDLIVAGAVTQVTIGNVVIRATLEITDLLNLRAALAPPVIVRSEPCQHICRRLQLTSTDGQQLSEHDLERLRQGLDRLLAP